MVFLLLVVQCGFAWCCTNCEFTLHGIVCHGNGAKLGVPTGGGQGGLCTHVGVEEEFASWEKLLDFFLNRIFSMQMTKRLN